MQGSRGPAAAALPRSQGEILSSVSFCLLSASFLCIIVTLLLYRFSLYQALRDATLEMLEEVRLQMSDLVYRRARHSVSEDRRTLATVRALEEKDYATVGESEA